jgi:hypothetical protein
VVAAVGVSVGAGAGAGAGVFLCVCLVCLPCVCVCVCVWPAQLGLVRGSICPGSPNRFRMEQCGLSQLP